MTAFRFYSIIPPRSVREDKNQAAAEAGCKKTIFERKKRTGQGRVTDAPANQGSAGNNGRPEIPKTPKTFLGLSSVGGGQRTLKNDEGPVPLPASYRSNLNKERGRRTTNVAGDKFKIARIASAKVLTGKADAFADQMRDKLKQHSGRSATQTAKNLNAAKVPGAYGGRWTPGSVIALTARIKALPPLGAKRENAPGAGIPGLLARDWGTEYWEKEAREERERAVLDRIAQAGLARENPVRDAWTGGPDEYYKEMVRDAQVLEAETERRQHPLGRAWEERSDREREERLAKRTDAEKKEDERKEELQGLAGLVLWNLRQDRKGHPERMKPLPWTRAEKADNSQRQKERADRRGENYRRCREELARLKGLETMTQEEAVLMERLDARFGKPGHVWDDAPGQAAAEKEQWIESLAAYMNEEEEEE